MSNRPFAAQLYSLRNVSDSFDAMLAQVAAAGFAGVETVGTHNVEAEELADLLQRHDLQVVSSHVALAKLESELDAVIAFWQRIGNKTLVVPWLDARPGSAAGWAELGKRLGRLGEQCQQAGMQLLYHNHDFEMVSFDGKLALEHLLDAADPAHLKLEPDVAWMVRGGQDPLRLLEAYRGRCPRLHVKDLAPAGENLDEGGWADVGYGRLDWQKLITKGREAGAEWFIVEHDEPKRPYESLRRSRAFLAALPTFSVD